MSRADEILTEMAQRDFSGSYTHSHGNLKFKIQKVDNTHWTWFNADDDKEDAGEWYSSKAAALSDLKDYLKTRHWDNFLRSWVK